MIKYCYLLKIKTKGHKINILIQIKGIEGYPFITRFKTVKGKHPVQKSELYVLKGIHL